MSANGAPFARGILLTALVAYVPVIGTALLVVRFTGGNAWVAWLSFLAASAAVLLTSYMMLAPGMRHLRAATALAEAIAAGDYGIRSALTIDDGEIGSLAVALNLAAENSGRIIGALGQERAQLEALLNASSDATVAVDRAGSVVYLNDAARHIFSDAASDATGRPFIQVVRDHDLNNLLLAAAQRGERSVRVVAYGQAQRWLQATAVPIEGAGAWAALAIFHDLTEVRQLDSVRRDFISNVSHELRTPLAGIRAAAETLQEGALEDHDAAIEFLGHIQRETDRMTQLVEELLELSRIESGAAPLNFHQIDAVTLVQDSVRRFAQQAERAGLRIASEYDEEALSVIGDGERLERALGNLIANAIKFTPPRGTITVAAHARDGAAEISVRDTGVGIEPEQQARVFERFYKADRARGSGGTGLGLAIVKHIVQAHEGSVSVESRPGRGSTFVMRLPQR
ncbi:MAG: cell wall metabolism sensor histidine kinase WalK [Chloroflexota bacterium]|nr:cell wall metabolism sensor histidine kinase WalK [Chloroflexota bacterium]